MSASLIIDARHKLRWHQRLLSDASTAVLWTGWLWLWAPLVQAYVSLVHLGVRLTPALVKLAAFGSEKAFSHAVVGLVGTSGGLIVWNRIPALRAEAAPAPALSLAESAAHFALPEAELRAAREASVCVVHHDAHGRIVRLAHRDAAPARLSA